MTTTPATIHDPHSGKRLSQVDLIDEPVPAAGLLSASGELQAYTILADQGALQDIWFDQQAVLLRTGRRQQKIKITTYPSEGENQGYLEFIEGTNEKYDENKTSPHSNPARGGFARGISFIQTLLST